MKIQVVVYTKTVPWNVQDELNSDLFNECNADIILFPGWSFRDTNHVENFQRSIKNSKTLGFLELKRVDSRKLTNALFCISKGELHFVSFQLFSTSGEIADNPTLGHMFLKQFREDRAFRVKGKFIRVIQCGELNILRNQQADKNKVAFRFSDKGMEREFRNVLDETALILNPLHTPMGNQGKMSKRRKYLSANRRGYISTCNVKTISDLENTKSAHYACFNGHELERKVVKEGKYFKVYEYEMKFA